MKKMKKLFVAMAMSMCAVMEVCMLLSMNNNVVYAQHVWAARTEQHDIYVDTDDCVGNAKEFRVRVYYNDLGTGSSDYRYISFFTSDKGIITGGYNGHKPIVISPRSDHPYQKIYEIAIKHLR